MPETVGQHKNGCPKGKEQSDGPPSRRLLCILFCDRENNTCLAAPHNAGLIADYVLGWYAHAKRRRNKRLGCWFPLDQILTDLGLSVNQWRKAKPWLEGAVVVEHGGNSIAKGKRPQRMLFMWPTAQLKRYVRGTYRDKKVALRALEALRQAPVEPEDTAQVAPVGTTAGQNQGQQGGQNLILSTLSPLSAHGDTKNQTFDLEKEKPGKIPLSVEVGPESKVTPPTPPAAGTVDLESLVELIYAAKVAAIDDFYGLEPQPPTEDNILFDQGAKKLLLNTLKKDLLLFPEVPIPKECTTIVHPMCKDPVGWAGLSKKAKTDLYANKFLPYLENWKNGKAGKHAANVYGFGNGGSGTKTLKYVPSEEDQALIDAEIASWDDDEVA